MAIFFCGAKKKNKATFFSEFMCMHINKSMFASYTTSLHEKFERSLICGPGGTQVCVCGHVVPPHIDINTRLVDLNMHAYMENSN